MPQRYRYSASILSILNRRKNHNLQSGFSGSFCYSLAKSNVFAPLTPLRGVQRKTLLPRAMGCTPFLTLTVQKIHCFFGPQSGLEKNRREQTHRKNCPQQFLLAHFLLIISAALKLSAKMVFALRTNQRAICPRTAQTKKERDRNSLPILTRLLL